MDIKDIERLCYEVNYYSIFFSWLLDITSDQALGVICHKILREIISYWIVVTKLYSS